MENLCNKIAQNIAFQLQLDTDRKEVIAYGLFALLQTIFSIMLVTIFGALFNVLIESLTISFVVSILRKYSGGVHASSSESCMVIGTLICIGQALISKFLGESGASLQFVIILGSVTFLVSYFLIYRLAPVDSPAKPIKKEETRKRMRKGSIIILSAYLIFVILGLITYMYTKNNNLIKYTLCIYMGVLWQVFTITTYGHLVMGKVDTFFTHKLKL